MCSPRGVPGAGGWETQWRAAGWVLAYPAVFDLWLQEAGEEPFKALF